MNPITKKQISKTIPLNRKQIDRALYALLQQGLVKAACPCGKVIDINTIVYSLTEKGQQQYEKTM